MCKIISKKNIVLSSLCILFFGLGFLTSKITTEPLVIRPKVLREGGYEYINPVLLCNTNNAQPYNENKPLSQKLSGYTQNTQGNKISVYFLSLNDGSWASVNENENYSPASMLKVSTIVETLKYSESHPEALSKQVYYDGSFDDNKAEYFKPQKAIQQGNTYSIDDLLTYMIIYSDNNALRLIHNEIPDSTSLNKLYKDLGIEIPSNSFDFMSTKAYSLFLRVLYNSTYLTRAMSQKTLKLMAESKFPQGIQAGVPDTVTVSQKFGERQVFSPDGTSVTKELHDCGIVYPPNNPYALCVMTRGQDFDSLATNIKEVSKMVYDEANK